MVVQRRLSLFPQNYIIGLLNVSNLHVLCVSSVCWYQDDVRLETTVFGSSGCLANLDKVVYQIESGIIKFTVVIMSCRFCICCQVLIWIIR